MAWAGAAKAEASVGLAANMRAGFRAKTLESPARGCPLRGVQGCRIQVSDCCPASSASLPTCPPLKIP